MYWTGQSSRNDPYSRLFWKNGREMVVMCPTFFVTQKVREAAGISNCKTKSISHFYHTFRIWKKNSLVASSVMHDMAEWPDNDHCLFILSKLLWWQPRLKVLNPKTVKIARPSKTDTLFMSVALRFKQAVARHVSKSLALEESQLVPLLRVPKKLQDGHYSLSLARLSNVLDRSSLDRGPDDISKEIAQKVRKLTMQRQWRMTPGSVLNADSVVPTRFASITCIK